MFRRIGAWLGIVSMLAMDVTWAFPPHIFIRNDTESGGVQVTYLPGESTTAFSNDTKQFVDQLAKFYLDSGHIILQNNSRGLAESFELHSELPVIVDSFICSGLKVNAPGVKILGKTKIDDFNINIAKSQESCFYIVGKLKTKDISIFGGTRIDGKLKICSGGTMNLGSNYSLIVNGQLSSQENMRINGSPLFCTNNGIVSSKTNDIFLSANEFINGKNGKILSDKVVFEGCFFRNFGELRAGNLTVKLPENLSCVPTLGLNFALFHQFGILDIAGTAILNCDVISEGRTKIRRLVFPSRSHLLIEAKTTDIDTIEGAVGILRAKNGANAKISHVTGSVEFVDGENAKLAIDLLESNKKTSVTGKSNAKVSFEGMRTPSSFIFIEDGQFSGCLYGRSDANATGKSEIAIQNAADLDLVTFGETIANIESSSVKNAYLLGNEKISFSSTKVGEINSHGKFFGTNTQIDEFANYGEAEFFEETTTGKFLNSKNARAIFHSGNHRFAKCPELSEGSVIKVKGRSRSTSTKQATKAPVTLSDCDATLIMGKEPRGTGTIEASNQVYIGRIPTSFHLKGNAEAFVGYIPEPSEIPDHKGEFHLCATLTNDFLNSIDRNYGDTQIHLDMTGHDFGNDASFFAGGLDIKHARNVANIHCQMNLRKFCIIEAENFLNEGQSIVRDNSRVVDHGLFHGTHVRFVMPAIYYSKDLNTHISVTDGPVKIFAAKGGIRNSFASIMAANGSVHLRAPRGIIENISGDLMALGEHKSIIEAQKFINRDLPAAIRSGEFYASGGSRGFLGLNDDRWSIYVCCSELVSQSHGSSAAFGGPLKVKADLLNRGSTIRAEGISLDGNLIQQDQIDNRASIQVGKGSFQQRGKSIKIDGGKIIALGGGIHTQNKTTNFIGAKHSAFPKTPINCTDFDLSNVLLNRYHLSNDNFTPSFIADRGFHRSIPFVGSKEIGDISLNNITIALACLNMPFGGVSNFLDRLATNNRSIFGKRASKIHDRSVIPDKDCLFYDHSHLFLRISSDEMKKIYGIQRTIESCDIYADDLIKIETERSMEMHGVIAESKHGDILIDGKHGLIHSTGSQMIALNGVIYLTAAKQIYETVLHKAFEEYNYSNYGYHHEWVEDVVRQAFVAQSVKFVGGEADLRGVYIDAKRLYDEAKYMLLTGAKERLYYWSWVIKKTLLSKKSAGTKGWYDVFIPTLISVDQFISKGPKDSDDTTKLQMNGVTIEGNTPRSSFLCTKDVMEYLPFVVESYQRNWESGSGISFGGSIRVENPLARLQSFFDAQNRTNLATVIGGLGAVATTIKLCENFQKTGTALSAISKSVDHNITVKGYNGLITVLMNYISGPKLSIGSHSMETAQHQTQEIGNSVHIGAMEASCPLSVTLCGDYDVNTGIIRTKSFQTLGRSVIFDVITEQKECGLTVDLLKAFVGYCIGNCELMCSAVSASDCDVNSKIHQEMHIPTHINGRLWNIEAENGRITHTQIIGDIVRAIFTENLTVETLADLIRTSAYGHNFSLSGANVEDMWNVAGGFCFGQIDQTFFQTKINEFALILSRGELILEAKKLVTKSVKIGNIHRDKSKERISVQQRFDEKVAEVSYARDNSFQLDISDLVTVGRVANDFIQKVKSDVFDQCLDCGKSFEETTRRANEAENQTRRTHPEIEQADNQLRKKIVDALLSHGATWDEIQQIISNQNINNVIEKSNEQRFLRGISVVLPGDSEEEIYRQKTRCDDGILRKSLFVFSDAAVAVNDFATENPRLAQFSLTAIEIACSGSSKFMMNCCSKELGIQDKLDKCKDKINGWLSHKVFTTFGVSQEIGEALVSAGIFGTEFLLVGAGLSSNDKLLKNAQKASNAAKTINLPKQKISTQLFNGHKKKNNLQRQTREYGKGKFWSSLKQADSSINRKAFGGGQLRQSGDLIFKFDKGHQTGKVHLEVYKKTGRGWKLYAECDPVTGEFLDGNLKKMLKRVVTW